MAHFKKFPQKKKEGKIVLRNGIVDGIVMLAVSEIPMAKLYSYPNASNTKSHAVNVSFDKEGVNVDVAVKIHYTQSIADMAFKIQEAIRYNVEAMTEYHIASVNVVVKSVFFDDDVEKVIENTTENNSGNTVANETNDKK